MNKRLIGYNFEKIAEDFLMKEKYQIIEKHFTIRGGEIDIISKKGDTISFVKVK